MVAGSQVIQWLLRGGDKRGSSSMPDLHVSEIFHSIQGESTWAGLPCLFVRLTGCPMRCVWCDTAYAFEGGRSMSLDSIIAELQGHDCRLVEVTGGEPLAQRETPRLITRLLDLGYTVLVETGGGVSIAGCDPRSILIYDIKCPGSGEEKSNLWENIPLLKPRIDEIKFVLASRADYLWALEVVRARALAERHTVLFSPGTGLLDHKDLAGWILEDEAPVRLQFQLHKLLWGPEARGV
jgi:7-carboxy-7-deazaguanine synthase